MQRPMPSLIISPPDRYTTQCTGASGIASNRPTVISAGLAMPFAADATWHDSTSPNA
jgi:hypothetical protein